MGAVDKCSRCWCAQQVSFVLDDGERIDYRVEPGSNYWNHTHNGIVYVFRVIMARTFPLFFSCCPSYYLGLSWPLERGGSI